MKLLTDTAGGDWSDWLVIKVERAVSFQIVLHGKVKHTRLINNQFIS